MEIEGEETRRMTAAEAARVSDIARARAVQIRSVAVNKYLK